MSGDVTPEAANSPWVEKEIDFWRLHKSPERLLIVQTDGYIAWDHDKNDFDWTRTTTLPRRLSTVFAAEPRWIDARWARTGAQASVRDPRFRDLVAELAAPLRGIAKDELIGEDIRQHRRLNGWRNAALGAERSSQPAVGGVAIRDEGVVAPHLPGSGEPVGESGAVADDRERPGFSRVVHPARLGLQRFATPWRVFRWRNPVRAPRLLRDGWTIEDTALHVARAGRAQQPPRWADAAGLADALLKGTVRPEEVHEIERLIWGIKDRQQREMILQALAGARPASLAAAKQVVEAQTPLPRADDDDAEIETDSQLPKPIMWPAESSLDERSLEQEYHESHGRHFQRLAERRFRQVLKVRIQPRWKFTGVPPAEREHLRDEIDHLIGWLKAARTDLEFE